MSNCRRNTELPEASVLVASLFYLLSRYASTPTASLAEAIAEHFEMLGMHPDERSEVMVKACERLSRNWERRAWDQARSRQKALPNARVH